MGISEDELKQYKQPAAFDDSKGAIPQPGVDATGPHMNYPEAVYKGILATPDEVFLNSVPNDPPVAN